MKSTIQFHIFKGEKYYIAEGTDLPIVTQGKTLDELVENLKEAIELHLQDEDISKYDIVPHPAVFASMDITPIKYAQA